MSRVWLTPWWAPLVLMALIATSCTGSSTADGGAGPFPEGEGLPRADETTAETGELEVPFDLGASSTTDAQSQIEFVRPEYLIISDGGSIRELDGSGNELVLATVKPLDVGSDPADGERFGRVDVGPGRLVLAELLVPDQPTAIVLIRAGKQNVVGSGTHPGVDSGGRFIVFVESPGDGSTNILTQRDLDGLILGEFEASGPILDVAIDPVSNRVAVLHEVGRSLGLTILLANVPGLAEQSSVAVSGDTTHVAFVGPNNVALGSLINGGGAVSIIDVVEGSIVSQLGLTSEISDLDWSASGDVGLVVTVNGSVLWVAGSATGLVVDAAAIGGRW